MLTSTEILVPPFYGEMEPPTVGKTYDDPMFGTRIKRLTDSTADGFAVPEYSQSSAVNLDDTRILLVHKGAGVALYDIGGNVLSRQLQTNGGERIHLGSRARWSRTSPHWIYYLDRSRTQIRRLDVTTMEAVDIGPQFDRPIDFLRYGDPSDDDRTVVQRGEFISVWDLLTGERVSSQELDTDPAPTAFQSTAISPDGRSFIVGFPRSKGVDRWQGTEQFDVNGEFMAQLIDSASHNGLGLDENGAPALFTTSAASQINDPPDFPSALIKISLDGNATRTGLLPFVWGLGMHFSAGRDGWVYVSTYDPQPGTQPVAANPADNVSGDDNLWHLYTNEILRVRGSVVERIAHTRSTGHRNFFYGQGHATISASGKSLVFGTDFMQPVRPDSYADAYLIDIDGVSPAPPPVEPPPVEPPTDPPVAGWVDPNEEEFDRLAVRIANRIATGQ